MGKLLNTGSLSMFPVFRFIFPESRCKYLVYFQGKNNMIAKSILFRLVNVEEASIVSGGSSSATPQFGLTTRGGNTTGRIMNADGNGKDVTIYEANNASNTKKDEVPYLDIALSPFPQS
jgi:hypothetical protein